MSQTTYSLPENWKKMHSDGLKDTFNNLVENKSCHHNELRLGAHFFMEN